MPDTPKSDSTKPLLIKRYASRRLYNTETSDYVTLEDIAEFIQDGRDVQIIDLKSGDDLTRQYLLQIIAEHESRGENVLPVNVLNDLVRSYTTQATSMVPEFLAASFEMMREGQSQMMEKMAKANPLAQMPGMDAMRAQQEAFMKAVMGQMKMPGMPSAPEDAPDASSGDRDEARDEKAADKTASPGEDLDEIKAQLSALQDKLSKLDK